MKIELVTQNDPLYILPFFEEFFRHYRSEFCIQRVLVSRAMGARSRCRLLRDLFLLYTPAGFLALLARLFAWKCLSILPRTKKSERFYSLRQLCKAYEVAFEEIANPNSQEVIDRMSTRRPDAVVSVACPYILKDTFLSVPSLGCINIHHAPLPRYKGMMPTFWQMLQGETHVGISVHYISARVDEGPMLLQESMEICPGETLDGLIRRSKRRGAHCVARALRDIAAGNDRAVLLDQTQGTYFTFPKPDEIRRFRRKGLRAI